MERNQLRERLTELEWKVTQEAGTEPAYSSEYLEFRNEGRYFCIVCNCELFDTQSQNFNECGWPSFHSHTEEGNIREQEQSTRKGKNNIEVRCKQCEAHLGHVFYNGRGKTGRNYCINGVALKFSPSLN